MKALTDQVVARAVFGSLALSYSVVIRDARGALWVWQRLLIGIDFRQKAAGERAR